MPCGGSRAASRIAQRPVLQPGRVESDGQADLLQSLDIRRHQMGHADAAPGVSMQPEPTGQRVLDPSPPETELTPGCGVGAKLSTYWHPMSPSTEAGESAETLPVKSAQVSGNDAGCVALADQPDPVASTMLNTTPGDDCSFNCEMSVV